MRDALICEPVRTPVGRFGGVFRDIQAGELAATVLRGLMERSKLPPEAVDDVIFGQCYPNGEAPALGRVAALDAGLPVEVGGTQVDRRCGSGLQAIVYAAMQVQTNVSDVVIAGGAESMSQVEFSSSAPRWGVRGEALRFEDRLVRARLTAGGVNYPVPGGMLETAENLRRDYGISREEQDRLALESHRRAVAAQEDGRVDAEVIPVRVQTREGSSMVARDEHPRADTSLEQLAKLRPVRLKLDPESTVTAGNA
ncbi:MAG: acetyl-CoA C-acyltransferase, partial [Chloroflexi bacterium]|nr:acetyl-CoA C-acyltransferase [Chloroflexota bacterium]